MAALFPKASSEECPEALLLPTSQERNVETLLKKQILCRNSSQGWKVTPFPEAIAANEAARLSSSLNRAPPEILPGSMKGKDCNYMD